MLALGIRYLNGFVVATEPDTHERTEWPPHPGRVFMALAAAHFTTGADEGEREALIWLESLDEAPAIHAGACFERVPVTQYVPVNDKAGPAKAQLQSAPLTRDRQARTFAHAALEHEVVYLTWPSAHPTDELRNALEGLCGKVSRIGHSASLVQMWVAGEDEVGHASWIPNDLHGETQLRVVGHGTLAELERLYNAGATEDYASLLVAAEDDSDKKTQRGAKKRIKEDFPGGPPPQMRPRLSVYRGYAPVGQPREESTARATVFSPYPVMVTLEREDGPRHHLDLPCVLAVVERWREAILSNSNEVSDSVRELLSGHTRGGNPLERPHLAFLPLAFVGHPHADGRLLGMGFTFPADVAPDDRRGALRVVGSVRHLALGRLGKWKVSSDTHSNPPQTLRSRTWTAHPDGATHWSTVTPVVFDRHPKAKDKGAYQAEVARMIATACTWIGLPEPREVIVTPVSAHPGVPPAFSFPRLRRKDGSERRHAHAILVFEEPVCGPMLIGAGRYRGYGVCRPVIQSVHS